jgi:hypothetical protein
MDRNKAEDLADKIFAMIDENRPRGLIKSDLVDLIATWKPSDPRWLKRILEQAAAEEWCVTIHWCCGAREMRRALGLARRRQMSPERAQELVAGLKSVTAEKQANPEPDANGSRSRCTTGLEPAVRYVLYAVWLSVGDDYFDQLSGTYAGAVLERMRGHYKRQRDLYEQRQAIAQSETAGVPPGCCARDLPKETADRLANLLSFAREKGRVCPMPQRWAAFYKVIRRGRWARGTPGGFQDQEVLKPAILSAWGALDNYKRNILRHQLEWAAARGRLDTAETFLRGLADEEWHYDRCWRPGSP